MDLKIFPSKLKGIIEVPASKSITHRYLICAALSKGKSIIKNPLICDDTLATIDVLKQLGAKFKIEKDQIIVKGVGKPKLTDRTLTILESATTLRVLLPILILFSKKVTITSTKRLIDRIYTSDLLDLKGLDFQRRTYSITITGNFTEKEFLLSGKITTQLISGMIVALPFLGEDAKVKVKDIDFNNPYIKLTIDALNKFGINFVIEDDVIRLDNASKFKANDVTVEGDFSNGAVWLAASVFHQELQVKGLNLDSIQGDKKMLDFLDAMGVKFRVEEDIITYLEGSLGDITLNIEETPDLAPILVATASNADGTVIIQGTNKLSYKESNRKLAIKEVCNLLGGFVKLGDDSIIIQGKAKLKGDATIASYNDHRIVMATAILATITENPVIIKNIEVVNKSYPNFFKDLARLGARFEVV